MIGCYRSVYVDTEQAGRLHDDQRDEDGLEARGDYASADAVQAIQGRALRRAYAAAMVEWASGDDASLWELVVADGLEEDDLG